MAYKQNGYTDWVNVKRFGAVGSGQVGFANIASSAALLNGAATGTFSATDVGATIMVTGAGASGADLWTTILTFIDSTQVTLSANAATTVTNQSCVFGMVDDTAAIQAAINAVSSSPNADQTVLYIPAGVYMISTPLDLSNGGTNSPAGFYGAGPEATYFIASQANISGTIALFNPAESPYITSLSGFAVYGHTLPTGGTPAAGAGAEVGLWIGFASVEDVWVNQTSFKYGLHIRNTTGTISRCFDFSAVFFAELDGAVATECSAVAFLCGCNYSDAYNNLGSEAGQMVDCGTESPVTTYNTAITAAFFFNQVPA